MKTPNEIIIELEEELKEYPEDDVVKAALKSAQDMFKSKDIEFEKMLSENCYCKTGEGNFYSKTRDSKQYCAFCWLKSKLKEAHTSPQA